MKELSSFLSYLVEDINKEKYKDVITKFNALVSLPYKKFVEEVLKITPTVESGLEFNNIIKGTLFHTTFKNYDQIIYNSKKERHFNTGLSDKSFTSTIDTLSSIIETYPQNKIKLLYWASHELSHLFNHKRVDSKKHLIWLKMKSYLR